MKMKIKDAIILINKKEAEERQKSKPKKVYKPRSYESFQVYYMKNRERIQQKAREYYYNNKERASENHKKWYQANHERCIQYQHEYKLKRKQSYKSNNYNEKIEAEAVI
jgi:hypothetical protein